MHERILSIEARRPRLINGLLDLEGAVHEPIGRMPRVRLDSARARTQGMGVISGRIEMLASPFNAIKKHCYNVTLLLAERTPSCQEVSFTESAVVSGRHEAAR